MATPLSSRKTRRVGSRVGAVAATDCALFPWDILDPGARREALDLTAPGQLDGVIRAMKADGYDPSLVHACHNRTVVIDAHLGERENKQPRPQPRGPDGPLACRAEVSNRGRPGRCPSAGRAAHRPGQAGVRPLVWQVTAFTVAHACTLSLAALGFVALAPRRGVGAGLHRPAPQGPADPPAACTAGGTQSRYEVAGPSKVQDQVSRPQLGLVRAGARPPRRRYRVAMRNSLQLAKRQRDGRNRRMRRMIAAIVLTFGFVVIGHPMVESDVHAQGWTGMLGYA